MWWVLQELFIERKKKFFSFFTLTPSQMWLKRPVYRGFKCEGRCEGRAFTLTPVLTLPSHFRHRKVSCQGFYLQNLTKVPEKYSCLVPTVQHRYTNSIAMLNFWCKGAAPLLALLFKSLYSGFSGGRRTSFLHSIILNRPTADNSSFFILIAALRSVSLRLQSLKSKNAHGISPIFFGVFSRIRFLIFSF